MQQCSRTKEYPLDGTKLKPVRSCPSIAHHSHSYGRYERCPGLQWGLVDQARRSFCQYVDPKASTPSFRRLNSRLRWST